jgi:hypothetical protein
MRCVGAGARFGGFLEPSQNGKKQMGEAVRIVVKRGMERKGGPGGRQ